MIFVTGGGGFLGSHLLIELCSRGKKVRALKRPSTDLSLPERIFKFYDQTNLFSSGSNSSPKRLRWSVEIEDVQLFKRDEWQKNIPSRGAVLDLATSPAVLVQVTLHSPKEYLIRIFAEKGEFSTTSTASFKMAASKIVLDNSHYAIRRTLEDFISEGVLPRELTNDAQSL